VAERRHGPPERRPGVVRAYRTVVESRIRSQTAYRVSFLVDVVGSVMFALVDLIEVYVIFHNVPTLGGLNLPSALLVFGLAMLGFALANTICGQLDTIPQYIRSGSLDVMLLRPQPLLAQIITVDISVRRLGASVVGAGVLAAGLASVHVHWTPARVALLVAAPFSAAGIFSALFLAAGAVQFWLIDAAEVTSAFTYGSSYASVYSSAVLPVPLRLTFAFIVPAAVTGYLPALVLLGLPGPRWLPSWLGWCTPLMAVVALAGAGQLWKLGIRHYSGAGG
jgi:ABC-2 type transport system permease protein